MHEEQFRLVNQEMEDLSKRNAHLHDQNVRFDIECAKLTDELQVALGRLEQLRNDNANLRAEKTIWEVGCSSFMSLQFSNLFFFRVFKGVSSKRIDHLRWKGLISPTS